MNSTKSVSIIRQARYLHSVHKYFGQPSLPPFSLQPPTYQPIILPVPPTLPTPQTPLFLTHISSWFISTKRVACKEIAAIQYNQGYKKVLNSKPCYAFNSDPKTFKPSKCIAATNIKTITICMLVQKYVVRPPNQPTRPNAATPMWPNVHKTLRQLSTSSSSSYVATAEEAWEFAFTPKVLLATTGAKQQPLH